MLDSIQLHQGPNWSPNCVAAASTQQYATADKSMAVQDERQQLLQDSMLLLEHRAQLQVQVRHVVQGRHMLTCAGEGTK